MWRLHYHRRICVSLVILMSQRKTNCCNRVQSLCLYHFIDITFEEFLLRVAQGLSGRVSPSSGIVEKIVVNIAPALLYYGHIMKINHIYHYYYVVNRWET